MEAQAQLVSWIILLPLAAGAVCYLLPRALEAAVSYLTVTAVMVSAGWAVMLFAMGRVPVELQPLSGLPAGPLEGMRLYFSLDALSAFAVLGISLFGLLTAIYSIGYMKGKERLGQYYAYFLWTLGASFGAVLASEFILLLVFWGVLGFTLFQLIGMGGPDASAAAKKSFIIIGGSDSLLILGIGIVWALEGTTRMDAVRMAFSSPPVFLAFGCFAAAAFAKAGAMPLHNWVPDCGEKAPAVVTAFLPASLDKLLGIYLLARVCLDLFVMTPEMNTLLMALGAGTILLAVMMALVQHDMKRLLSYHAVSQVGYMVLGIGTGTPLGIAGGLFHMINHAIYKSCLFLSAGAVERQAGGTDLDRLGGLGKVMPWTFGAFVIAALSISGIPPLNGFFSKWMIYQGIIELSRGGDYLWVVWLAAAMLGSALTLASFVKVMHAVFLCERSKAIKDRGVKEAGWSMTGPMAALAVLCVLFGIWADLLPLPVFIRPVVGFTFTGEWAAAPATVLLAIAFAAGFLIYFFTTARHVRQGETYIGGEVLESGEDIQVTGADFYETIQDMAPFKTVYRLAERKLFDLYETGFTVLNYFVGFLRDVHTGRLPWYVMWVLAGFLAVLYILRQWPVN